jgi:hypothetical protein
MSKSPGYDITFGFPEGWVQLPVTNSTKVGHDKELEHWAAGMAPLTLAPSASPDQVAQRARDLVELTVGCRLRKDWYGLLFYPRGTTGLVAALDIERYVPSRTYPEMSLEVLEGIFGRQSADTVGEIASSRADLPSGPAIRVRGKRVEEPDLSGLGTIREELTYAIRPPTLTNALVVTMSWTALQHGDKLAEMADAIARTIRVTPA